MRTTATPLKQCQVCPKMFTPRLRSRRGGKPVWSRHCSWDCAMVTARSKQFENLKRGRATRVVNLEKRRRQRYEAEFGPLSARELALITTADERGYRRGYASAYAPLRKKTS